MKDKNYDVKKKPQKGIIMNWFRNLSMTDGEIVASASTNDYSTILMIIRTKERFVWL
jgi:hypothetical protein